jgi:hypothetical protein
MLVRYDNVKCTMLDALKLKLSRMPIAPVSRPRRRLLRISVRTLIVLVLMIGAGMAWIVRSAQIQSEAVAAIESTGGVVVYDCEFRKGSTIPGREPWAPQWLVNLIGISYFGHVTDVRLDEEPDVAIAHAGRLSRLENLFASQTSVRDEGLIPLKALTHPRSPMPDWRISVG